MTVLDDMRSNADRLFRGGQFNEAVAAYSNILKVVPSDFSAVHRMGQLAIHLGKLEEGRKLLEGALHIDPNHAEVWLHLGMALQHLGRTDEALAAYDRALGLKPDNSEALFCMAVTQKDAGRTKDAVETFNTFIARRGDVPAAFLHRGDLLRQSGDATGAMADYESALNVKPDYLEAWMHRGVLLTEIGRPAEALAAYDQARALAPTNGAVLYNRGVALQDLGREAEALEAYDNTVQFLPEFPDAWNNRGTLLRKAGKTEEALASFERALKCDPRHLPALTNRGASLSDLRRFDEALASYDLALVVAPESSGAWSNRGVALQALGRDGEALAAYERSLALDPAYADSWNNRGNLLKRTGRAEDAMASFQRALALDPRHPGALANAGAGLQTLGRFAEAAREFRKLETVNPDHEYVLAGLAISAAALCDWPALDLLMPRLEAEVTAGTAIVPPLTLLGLSDDPAWHRGGTIHYLKDLLGPMPDRATPAPISAKHDKIQLAYLSADFYAHATARLMADLFARHDRERFEVIGISFGPDRPGAMRERLTKAFDQFHEVRGQSDAEVAALLKRLDVDIAVDLKGHTEGARPGIFAHRAAPVQVNYLGYPGSWGSDVMDYVIVDKVVLPLDQQPFYAERIVHLPDSYQCNDPSRSIGAVPSRAEAGLPSDGFVFSCFNNHWKITAAHFDVWMRLLEKTLGSVLWLLDDSGSDGLRAAARARGIDPARLVFAPKLIHEEHLARLSLADLVLDTTPYNAHTTASDALWTGVPLVTVPGRSFASRVAASLLTALGLPELIAADLKAYEALALSLAQNPDKHKSLREKLAKNRKTAPLFDAPRFCRHIEAAYVTMAEVARRGEAPRAFAVPD